MKRCGATVAATVAAVSLLVAPPAAASGELLIEPGSFLTITGRGCGAHHVVTVTIGASHSSGRILGTVAADPAGRFSIRVQIPFLGEPTASLAAECLDPSGRNTVTAASVTIRYVAPSPTLPSTGGRGVLVFAATGTGLVGFGIGLVLISAVSSWRKWLPRS